ncbi:hypothetical protein AGOR_G00120630 [Albula goreensis]|uniref:Ig-like domain-containing protein n=1 Tax=Albula goreensis TaxID=1534307 RepID=A0A8T3DFP0_9TELE|nr:hypothetical protein AGOR_G00120630 [Albula goreensis]
MKTLQQGTAMVCKTSGVILAFLCVSGVVDLQVSVDPDTVTEGQSVTLTCRTTCTLSKTPAFIWYKNNQRLSFTSQQHQITASSGDAGRYSCAIQGYGILPSPAVTLSVQYAPKHTSVTVSPSGEIEEDSSVTLTCSSDANPPVQRYTWFKKTGAQPLWIASRQNYSINKIKISDSGEYYCQTWNGIGTGTSPPKRLDVQYPPKHVKGSVSPSGEIEEGSSVTLTCSSDANPPVQRYTWFKKTGSGSSERGTGESRTITNISSEDSGQYYCEAQNQHGALSSTAVTVDVHYSPKNTSASVGTSIIQEGSSVTLTCSSDANPPVQRYTWFKKTGSGSSERGTGESYTFTNISSEDSGQYYCEAQNQHGALSSTAVTVDVHYPPKSPSLSVSPSGEIEEGSSVTLTCNPPVQNYTWFKKNESGVWLTGSGQSLNFSNFRSWNSGLYYCETENTHGTHNATTKLIMKDRRREEHQEREREEQTHR